MTQLPAWKALQAHYQTLSEAHLRDLFAQDPQRGEQMAIEAVGLYLDYSKQHVTAETIKRLIELANECDLRRKIDAMFRGDKINFTESRAVLPYDQYLKRFPAYLQQLTRKAAARSSRSMARASIIRPAIC